MNIETEERDQALIVRIIEKHLDAGNVDAFKEAVPALITGHDYVVLDLRELEFVDSSGLGAFLSCMRQLSGHGGSLSLCEVAAPVQTLFELVRMNRILDIHHSVDDALRARST